MKHFLTASAVIGLSVLANACGTSVDETTRAQYTTGNTTLTLFVYDALSGGTINNATVTIQVADEELNGISASTAYIVEKIPNGSFPVTIAAEGYLLTTGIISFNNTQLITSNANPNFINYIAALYPTQSVTADESVKIFDASGNALTSGTLLAAISATTVSQPGSSAGSGQNSGATVFTGSIGFLPDLISAQIANGVATLPRDQLAYGATYTLTVVGASSSSGQYLVLPASTTFVAGQSANPLTLFVAPAASTLVAVKANNENPATTVNNLVVTFGSAVDDCVPTSALTWTRADASTNTAAPPATNAVTVQKSTDGTVLTLNYAVDSTTPDTGAALRVTFQNVRVKYRGAPESACVGLGSISLRNSSTLVSPTITVHN